MNTPIRILQVVTYMGRGGLETMLMQYYRHIDRNLVQFDFLVHRPFRADYDDEIEALGGKIYRLPRLVPWRRSYKKALSNFFAAHPEYRIVHVHQDCLSGVILQAAQEHGVPVRIAHSHNSNQDFNWKYPIKRFYMRNIPTYATALLACGKAAGDWLFGGKAYQVLPNAIDLDSYRPEASCRRSMRKELGIAENAFVVGHVGRFHPVKNHAFLLRVFAKIKKQRSNACLLLVGDGYLRQKIQKNAAKMGLSDCVIFTGVRQDVPQLMQAMDVFILPSVAEGLPVTLVEAQAAGLPCVASTGVPRESGLTDLVRFLPLKAGFLAWSEQICQCQAVKADTHRLLEQAGYAIGKSAGKLQQYYLNMGEECVNGCVDGVYPHL